MNRQESFFVIALISQKVRLEDELDRMLPFQSVYKDSIHIYITVQKYLNAVFIFDKIYFNFLKVYKCRTINNDFFYIN